jgi:hypothetical protein
MMTIGLPKSTPMSECATNRANDPLATFLVSSVRKLAPDLWITWTIDTDWSARR